MKLGFLVLVLALLVASCGGGGGSPGVTAGGSTTGTISGGGTAVTSQLVTDLALHSSTSGADLAAVPAGTVANFFVVGSTTTNGSTTTALSGVTGNCGTAILCQRTDGFASVKTVALSTTAPVSLNSGAPINLTVDSTAVAGSTFTLTVTETTGRQVTRTFLTS